MTVLALLLGLDPDTLKAVTALLSLIAAACTATSAAHGILNRRRTKRTEGVAADTLAMVARLVEALGVATPEQVQTIATKAASATVDERLAPVHQFFAALELVEHRRDHRPETDVIRILEQERAA